MKLIGVLLAAGRSSRFGADKRLVPLASGVPIAVAACRALVAALPEVVAVVRPEDRELCLRLRETGARVVECERADEGMGASLACGIAACADAKGWLVALADMPWIHPATIARVARAVREGGSIVAPYYHGARGHPVGFEARHRDALRALSGDEGAREIIASNARDLVRIDVDDPAVLRDVDVPGDLIGAPRIGER